MYSKLIESHLRPSWVPAENSATPPWKPAHVQTGAIRRSESGTDGKYSRAPENQPHGNRSDRSSRDPAETELVV